MKRHLQRIRISWAVVALGMVSTATGNVSQASSHLTPYGYIKADAVYETAPTAFLPVGSRGDWAYFVPPDAGDGEGIFTVSARETRLGVRLAAAEHGQIQTTGVVEGDFFGGGPDAGYTPRLRLAYLDLAWANGVSLRAGHEWDAFVTFHPRTLDTSALGFAGHIYGRRPQVRVTYATGTPEQGRVSLRVAAARTTGPGAAQSEYPTLQGGVILERQLANNRVAVAGLTGHWGRESVRIPNAEGGVHAGRYDTWSAIASLLLPVTRQLTLQGTLWRGANLDAYIGGIGQGINPELDTEIHSTGGWLQVLADASDSLTLGAGYGAEQPDGGDLSDGQRERNERLFANAFFRLTPDITLGGEIAHLNTQYKAGETARANRVQFSIIYRF